MDRRRISEDDLVEFAEGVGDWPPVESDRHLAEFGIDGFDVTAQVGWTVHESRSDFTRADGSRVRAPMIFQPCFMAVETNERMVPKSVAPSAERKPPEIFWRSFIMRPSRSA